MSPLKIIQPDDWHLHLRDSLSMQSVVNDTARQFARAIIMPNLVPPVTTCEQACAYRERILAAVDTELSFEPLMTLYLTDNTSSEEIRLASESPFIHAAKLYPAGATTNSDAGVSDIKRIHSVLEAMQQYDLPLLVHGEATANEIDIFDREKAFIDQTLTQLRKDYPELRIVFEHITTSDAVSFVLEQTPAYTAGTITAHHLLINRNALFKGGMNPHHYCLPVVKRETHRLALLKAATQHADRFFCGTDSAPHAQGAKESACGCAGIYTAHAAIELYAEAFEQALDFSQFEQFMSLSGPAFYHLPVNTRQITLDKQDWTIADSIPFAHQTLIPFRAGQTLSWKLEA
jgi:dihydroorotase